MDDVAGLRAIRSLDYTVLLCQDLAVMRDFYRDIMGFAEIPHDISAHWVEFRVGSAVLALRPHGAAFDGKSPSATGASVQLAFRVPPSEVASAAAQLSARGIALLEPVTDKPFGHRTLFFADPERNVIEIYAEI